MAELKVEDRVWHFRVDFEPGEVPALKKQYTAKLVYEPYCAQIRIVASNGQKPRLSKLVLNGTRVTKNGPGAMVIEDFYGSERMPEWLGEYINFALCLAECELNWTGNDIS